MSAVPVSRYLFGTLPLYSVLIVAGALIAVLLAIREEKIVGLKKDTILDLALWVLPIGIIGARIYYVAFSWKDFQNDLLSVFRIWEGGIAIYGALIAGLVTVLVFARIRGINPLTLCDIVAPGVILAQAIGRWGNYFNMEAYGAAVTNPALQFFPFAVLIPADTGTPWHMATFFYESVWNLLIFVFLIIARRRYFRKSGDCLFFYAFLYACGRLVIEDFRTDSLYAASSVRISQLLSVLICIGLLVYYFVLFGRKFRTGSLFFVLSLLSAVPVLGYCLNIAVHPAEIELLHHFFLLGAYSLLNIVTLFLLYGKTSPDEVIYAVHKN